MSEVRRSGSGMILGILVGLSLGVGASAFACAVAAVARTAATVTTASRMVESLNHSCLAR